MVGKNRSGGEMRTKLFQNSSAVFVGFCILVGCQQGTSIEEKIGSVTDVGGIFGGNESTNSNEIAIADKSTKSNIQRASSSESGEFDLPTKDDVNTLIGIGSIFGAGIAMARGDYSSASAILESGSKVLESNAPTPAYTANYSNGTLSKPTKITGFDTAAQCGFCLNSEVQDTHNRFFSELNSAGEAGDVFKNYQDTLNEAKYEAARTLAGSSLSPRAYVSASRDQVIALVPTYESAREAVGQLGSDTTRCSGSGSASGSARCTQIKAYIAMVTVTAQCVQIAYENDIPLSGGSCMTAPRAAPKESVQAEVQPKISDASDEEDDLLAEIEAY